MLRRSGGVILLLIAAVALAQVTQNKLVYSVVYLLASLLLISLLLTVTNLFWMQVERHAPTHRSQVGKLFEETITVLNRGPLLKLWLEVRDHSTLPNHRAGRVISSLGPRRRRTWNVRTYCTRRGRFNLGPLTLHSGDPFGFFAMKRKVPDMSHVVVYPATIDIAGFQLPYGELPGGEAMRRRTHYVTDNVAGIRDWVYGDSFNRIHWKSTARTGRLMVKEFELDPATDVWIYLDMDHAVHVSAPWAQAAEERDGPAVLWTEKSKLELAPTTEEYAVTAAASLARHLLAQGRAVGMVAYGQSREVIQTDRGERQLAKMLETLAVLEAEGRQPFGQVLAAEGENLPHGTTIIAITPSAELGWVQSARELMRRGVRIVAVLVDAHSFTSAPSQAPIMQELSASQIPTFEVKHGVPLSAALSEPAAGPAPDARLTGAARVA